MKNAWDVRAFRVGDAPTRLTVVIESDGQASIERVRQTIGNHGLYGCAICEQIHRLPVAACPLSMVTRRNVLLDPCEMVAGEMVLLAAVESSPERRKGAS